MAELKQRSMEWRQLRVGDVTASRFKDIKGAGSKSEGYALSNGDLIGKTAFAYIDELLAELMTGKPQDRIGSPAPIAHGNIYEDIHRDSAREELWTRFGKQLILPEGDLAYIQHPTEPHIGFSPDYGVGEPAGGEMKCPWNQSKHMAYLRGSVDLFMSDRENKAQVYGGMWIAGWGTYYVSSFHPDFPKEHRLVLWEVERDEAYIAKLSSKVLAFRDLLLEEYARLIGGPF